jgi:hypothetical protein
MIHPNKVSPTLWSQAQSAEAAQIWQSHFVDYHGDDDPFARQLAYARNRVIHRIARAIGKSFDSVEYRMETRGASFGANQRAANYAPACRMADAEARRMARDRDSLTAQFFGDPPPGYATLGTELRSFDGAVMIYSFSTFPASHACVPSSPRKGVFTRVCPRCKRYPQVQG